MKKFSHLNIPEGWQHYWSRYPQGYTIMEALISWVSQVDSMVDNQNILNINIGQFRNEIDEFVGRFDERLQDEVTQTLQDWQASGFLDVVIDEALQTQMDLLEQETSERLNEFNQQIEDISINIKTFGAKGDGVTDDHQSFQNAFDYCIANNHHLYVPPGVYILDSTQGPVYLNFNSDYKNLIVKGAGKGITVIKEKSGSVKQLGRWTRMFYLYLTTSVNIGNILFEDITFDKNGSSNGKSPTSWEWEQAHIFHAASSNWSSISPTMKSFKVKRCEIKDKVGAGFVLSTQMPINEVTYEELTSTDFNDLLYGERGDLEIHCFSEKILINDSKLRYIQTEPENGYEATSERKRTLIVSNSEVRKIELSEPTFYQTYGESQLLMSNTKCKQFSIRNINALIENSEVNFNITCWSNKTQVSNSLVFLSYDTTTNSINSINTLSPNYHDEQSWSFSNCQFIVDSSDRSIKPTGYVFNNPNRTTAKGMLYVSIDNCQFDPRFESILTTYGRGEYVVTNSRLNCWGDAFECGTYGSFVSYLELSNNDYQGCLGELLYINNAVDEGWELRFNDVLTIDQYRVSIYTGNRSLEGYKTKPTLVSSSKPSDASQQFYVGDRVVNSAPTAGGYEGWVCVTAGKPGTWKGYGLIEQ